MDGPEQRPHLSACLASQTDAAADSPRSDRRQSASDRADRGRFRLRVEFVGAARIVRLNSQARTGRESPRGSAIRSAVGKATSSSSRPAASRPAIIFASAPPVIFSSTPRTRVTERFARVAPDTIDYTFTVEDPTYYTRAVDRESHFLRRTSRCSDSRATRRTTPSCIPRRRPRARTASDHTSKADRPKSKARCSCRCTTSCDASREREIRRSSGAVALSATTLLHEAYFKMKEALGRRISG
jgi:hypothetical protein